MRLIVVLVLLLLSNSILAMNMATRFEHIKLEHGLSQTSVISMAQDNQGFLWFGTWDGLNRYDGYQFKTFYHAPDDPHSLSGNIINSLYYDSLGILWVGTDNGLNRYDSQTQTFSRYQHQTDNPVSISNNYIWSIYEDDEQNIWVGTNNGLNLYNRINHHFKRFNHNRTVINSLSHHVIKAIEQDLQGHLWIGTDGGGLNRYEPQTQSFTHFTHQTSKVNSLSSNHINTLRADPQGALWIGSKNKGLSRFDPQSNQFSHYPHASNNNQGLSHDSVMSLLIDNQGMLWIGTDGGGINQLNPKTQEFTPVNYHTTGQNGLSSDRIHSITQDRQGNLWFGTFTGGVNKFVPRKQRFGYYKRPILDSNDRYNNVISALFVDQQKNLWIGTLDGGLYKQNAHNGQVMQFKHQANDPHSLSQDSIWAINQTANTELWAGTWRGGLNRYNPKLNRFIHFNHQPQDPNSLSHDGIKVIMTDSNQVTWIGTLGGGLNRYDHQTQQFSHFKHDPNDPNSLSHDTIQALHEDTEGYIWVGTESGLNQFAPNQQRFRRFEHDPNDPTSLSHTFVTAIHQDTQGTIWIATYGGGLNQYDHNTGDFIHYRIKHGLPNDVLYAILEDQEQNLWLSSNKGISKFNINDKSFINYDVNDGLQSNEFVRGAYFKAEDGEMFFGGANGFNRFYPSQIIDDPTPPTVVLTNILLNNQPVPIRTKEKIHSDGFFLTHSIDRLKQLTLDYRQNLMTFEFSALHYTNPNKNRYKYKLEGWDKNWLTADTNIRRATYTNIPAGIYTLRVKASNPDGYWNRQGSSLQIKILPPPWKTWWAYSLYFATVLALLLLFVHAQRKKVRYQQSINQQLTAVDKLKDEFLANTSHELRTPLNGIIGLAESLVDGVAGKLPDEANRNLTMIVSSGRRLANLVNDILDFSKLKNHNLELHLVAVDLYSMSEVVLALSKPLVKDKNLKLINNVPKNINAVLADEDRLQQILHNLIGNGIKFSDSGQVSICAYPLEQGIEISVTDTGIGIAEEDFDSLFDSFEQVKGHLHRSHSGSGLGLAVSKQLVELHDSQIRVISKLGEGSSFSFILEQTDQEPKAQVDQQLSRLHLLESDTQFNQPIEDQEQTHQGNKARILLVDDEPINRQVLNNHLSLRNYQLVEAIDGVHALECIEKQGPFDLILLDMMMPKMSGFEVCKQIRKQHSVYDLPVIFLTAKNQVADLVQSFNVGANDYLSKPVSKPELLARVSTHLKFLALHRDLEHAVAKRTAELKEKNQQVKQQNKEIIKTQQQLIHAEKMSSLGTLTAGMAHEINNPSNFVHLGAHNLIQDLTRFERLLFDLAGAEAPEEVLNTLEDNFIQLYDHIQIIKNGIDRIKLIIKGLKTFTQLNNATEQTVDIAKLLHTIVDSKRQKHQQISQIEEQLNPCPQLSCFPDQLNLVFTNIINNAADAISHKQQDDPQFKGQIKVRCEHLEQHIHVTISDNGCGMSEETQSKLYEPFYTTKPIGDGTGLGLSVSFGIVQIHHGEIKVESIIGRGSTIIVKLPV